MKEQEIRMALADRLHRFRLQAGLTAKAVGAIVGKNEKTVSGWEHGRGQPDADTLFVLCDLYNIKDMNQFYMDVPSATSIMVSANELELLNYYRQLHPSGQSLLMATAKSFAINPEMQKEPSPAETA